MGPWISCGVRCRLLGRRCDLDAISIASRVGVSTRRAVCIHLGPAFAGRDRGDFNLDRP
jgi:hypothetical protein